MSSFGTYWANICIQLDRACPNYEFFYMVNTPETHITVYKRGDGPVGEKLAMVRCPKDEVDYVVTKLVLQFS